MERTVAFHSERQETCRAWTSHRLWRHLAPANVTYISRATYGLCKRESQHSFSSMVQHFLNATSVDRLPRSVDLSPRDFFFWRISLVYETPADSTEDRVPGIVVAADHINTPGIFESVLQSAAGVNYAMTRVAANLCTFCEIFSAQ